MALGTSQQAKVDAILSALTNASASLDGIATDIRFLKDQIAKGANTADVDAALQSILDKAQLAAQSASVIDAQTDSSAAPADPGTGGGGL